MIRIMLMITGALLFCEAPAACPEPNNTNTEMDTMVLSAAIAGALQDEAALQPELIHSEGYYIWQQPGAALAITGIGTAESQPKLWYQPAKLASLIATLPEYQFGNPFVHPREPEDSEFTTDPQVWLLDAEQSTERMATYMEGYQFWVDVNGGEGFIVPDAADLAMDGALVFIDSGGPVEFHFQRDADGALRLRHILIWDYFSA